MRERQRREQEDPAYERPDDFLQHLIDGGRELEDDEATTVQRLMVTYLGSGPSTIIAVAQVLFDLCAHPEYVEVLREEALQVLRTHGGFTKQALVDMKKMDSFMRESQRLSPPTLLGFNAIVRQNLSLHDGTILLRYHLRFPGGATERPANSSLYDVVIPDLSTCVEFKLRTDAQETVF